VFEKRLEKNIDNWKKNLLELGKRNRLINYRETKRSNINISTPEIGELFEELVLKENPMIFPEPIDELFDEEDDESESRFSGNIRSDRSLSDEQKTLRSLRNKAKSYIEEQGINVLYMSFGFLEWREAPHSDVVIKSPLVLVPVSLTIESITDPYVLRLHEDEIVMNPTLSFKLEEEFGIKLPEYDTENEDIVAFLKSIEDIIGNSSWKISFSTSISLLSFMKMNMYKDIENNIERIKEHPVLKALAGDTSSIEHIPEDYDGFDHDAKVRPIDTFQVVDADSSQQDAILYSKKNISFILQGPPGTGKSQTITNIISEGLADGKKILFVSEKAAALEVVYSRLSNVGLSEFCMSLHNNKKNKKEVLNDLHQTFTLDKKVLKEDAIYALHNLETERKILNQYANDIHIKNEPLNMSIFEITGELAALPDGQDLVFGIEHVEQITNADIIKIKKALDDFSHVLGMMKKSYKDNPWVGCNLKSVTHEFRLNAIIELEELYKRIKEINVGLNSFNKAMNVDWSINLDELDDYIGLLDYLGNMPREIPEQWFEEKTEKIINAIQKAKDYKYTLEDYYQITDNLQLKYDEKYFDIDGQKFYDNLNCLKTKIKEMLNEDSFSVSYAMDNVDKCIGDVSKSEKALSAVLTVALSVSEQFNLNPIKKYDEIVELKELLVALEKKPNPTEMWFDENQYKVVEELLVEAIEKKKNIEDIQSLIESNFEKDIINIEYKEMLVRFRTQYTNFLKVFKKPYKTDKSLINGMFKGTDKITDEMIMNALQSVSELHENKMWFVENEEILKKAFGKKYLKENTDWESIAANRANFNELKTMLGNSYKNGSIVKILCDSEYIEELVDKTKCIHEYISSQQWNDVLFLLKSEIVKNTEILSIPKILKKFETVLFESRDIIETLNGYSSVKVQFEILMNDLEKKAKLEFVEADLERNYQNLKEVFKTLFAGTDTNWNQIIELLEWTEKFLKYKAGFELSDTLIEQLKISTEYNQLLKVLNRDIESFKKKWNWFKSLFDEYRGIADVNTVELNKIIENCISGITLLEEWVDYKTNRQTCEDMGLSEYIQKAEEAGMLKTHLRIGYLRRFYKLWLDANIAKYPSVLNFRQRVHMERIDNFIELDKLSFEVAKARIRTKLIDSLPNRNYTASAGDEISILNREMSKRRRIMPLRKLFAAIPNLLMTLKPCMMMSPLSVSLFLQADTYDFDIVIFDEASQVKTEDAVGAIMRGKSVIICGDDKQLPPTSFFGTSKSGDDFDTDSDEEEYDSYESILDEALTVLSNRTLKWHYRSRHEHLIAFSNAKIYNNELITFPSCKDDVPNEGVEYVYVEDGVYDRGGSRSNSLEAQRVAKLVMEHFTTHPNRSLGVVTFSTSQQTAVEDELRILRKKNNSYEHFFSEENNDAFFVKNLETVQGDERDTIIFSIGYAKDGTGKPMAMNFGPLSKVGGERRLNVAVTRAKYNVKLVGSIHPTDIDLDRTSSEGVQLLRSYIEFAKHGPRALEKEITVNSEKEFDSPFEKSVYDYLVRKGHKIDTQVGCSGYKIDLGVRHPEYSGVYILGIECDGATYHSTRTARERDRIRQTVLEDMGWKIHRIWSTDYIKDPKRENDVLLELIEKLIEDFVLDGDEIVANDNIQVATGIHEKMLQDAEETINILHPDIDKYGVVLYKATDMCELDGYYADIEDFSSAVKKVVEVESPIHFELLCRRIAPLTGREKATKVVRDIVATALSYCEDSLEYINEFVWSKSEEELSVRIPESEYDIRDISHIAPEEIAEAMKLIIKNSFGITQEGLFTETRRIFGFSRAGQKITRALDETYENLIDKHIIKMKDERLVME